MRIKQIQLYSRSYHFSRERDESKDTDSAPEDPAAREAWALAWARLRVAAKKRRDFTEADRIRSLLASEGWEVRDRKDGTVEVARK